MIWRFFVGILTRPKPDRRLWSKRLAINRRDVALFILETRKERNKSHYTCTCTFYCSGFGAKRSSSSVAPSRKWNRAFSSHQDCSIRIGRNADAPKCLSQSSFVFVATDTNVALLRTSCFSSSLLHLLPRTVFSSLDLTVLFLGSSISICCSLGTSLVPFLSAFRQTCAESSGRLCGRFGGMEENPGAHGKSAKRQTWEGHEDSKRTCPKSVRSESKRQTRVGQKTSFKDWLGHVRRLSVTSIVVACSLLEMSVLLVCLSRN